MKKQIINIFDKANAAIKIIEEFFLGGAVFIMALLLISNVVGRNLFKPIYFVEEIAMVLSIMVTFVGLGYGTRNARHVRMSAIADLMPERVQKGFAIFSSLLSAVIMVILGVAAIQYVIRLKNMKQLTPVLSFPYWIFVLSAPVGFFLAALRYLMAFFLNFIRPGVWIGSDAMNEYDDGIVVDHSGV